MKDRILVLQGRGRVIPVLIMKYGGGGGRAVYRNFAKGGQFGV